MTDKKPGIIKNFFQKKKLWYVNKKTLLREFDKVTRIANLNIESALKTLESMEQNKIYFLILDDWEIEDLLIVKETFMRSKNQLKWSAPNIIFINKKIDLLDEEEINQLIKKYKSTKQGV